MTTLIAIGSVQALFLAALAFAKPRRSISDALLSTLLALLAAMFATAFAALAYDLPDLLLLLTNAGLLIAPVFFLYTRSLLSHAPGLRRRDLLHFLAYGLSWLYWLGMILAGLEGRLDQYFLESRFSARSVWFNAVLLAELVCVPIYVFLSLRELAAYRRFIAQRLAYREGVDYRWLVFLTRAVSILWALLAIPDFLSQHGIGPETTPTLLWSFVAATPLVFYLGFFGLRQTSVFQDPGLTASLTEPLPSSETTVEPTKAPSAPQKPTAPTQTPGAKYRKAGLDRSAAQEMLQRLEEVMAQDQPYLDPKLSLGDLAARAEMSAHYLSQLINEHLETSFYDFVNGYRVDAFKRRISRGDHQTRTLLAIALDCGFNAKSSFNRIFKKATGQTPSAYVRSQNNE